MSTAAAEWALEHGVTPRCPTWCAGDHHQAILEGNEPSSVYEHCGAECGEILLELRCPFGEHEVLRRGGDGWTGRLEQVQGPNGWISRTRAYVEFTNRDEDAGTDNHAVLELTSGELRDLSRALAKMAEAMD